MQAAILILMCAAGGAAGSALRYALSVRLDKKFPFGTLLSNILSSLLLAAFAAKTNLSGEMSALLATGFCGAFSTFSSFAFQVCKMIKEKDFALPAIYIASTFSILACVYAVLKTLSD